MGGCAGYQVRRNTSKYVMYMFNVLHGFQSYFDPRYWENTRYVVIYIYVCIYMSYIYRYHTINILGAYDTINRY